MENLDIGISTQEPKKETLTAKKVTIENIKIEKPNNKEGKEMKEKFVFECKHPDKEQLIEISKVKYEKNGKLEVAGTWKSLDETGNLLKNSATANLLRKYEAKTLKEMLKKTIETTTEQNGYLVFKAY